MKLSPDELNQLWEVLEDAMDNFEADEALKEEGENISLEDLKRKLEIGGQSKLYPSIGR